MAACLWCGTLAMFIAFNFCPLPDAGLQANYSSLIHLLTCDDDSGLAEVLSR